MSQFDTDDFKQYADNIIAEMQTVTNCQCYNGQPFSRTNLANNFCYGKDGGDAGAANTYWTTQQGIDGGQCLQLFVSARYALQSTPFFCYFFFYFLFFFADFFKKKTCMLGVFEHREQTGVAMC